MVREPPAHHGAWPVVDIGGGLCVGWAVTWGNARQAQAACTIATGLSNVFVLLMWMDYACCPPVCGSAVVVHSKTECSNSCKLCSAESIELWTESIELWA